MLNPSFESDDISALSPENNSSDGLRGYKLTAPAQWTRSGSDVVSLIVTPNCYTDNNFGLVTSVADGQQAYYLRMGWNTGTTTLSTTTAELPVGKYRLSVDYRSAYANSAVSSFTLSANGVSSELQNFEGGSTGIFAEMPWSTQSLDFELTDPKAINISLDINWLSGGSCIMFDNLRLLRFLTPEEVGITSPDYSDSEYSEHSEYSDNSFYTLDGRKIVNSKSVNGKLNKGLYIHAGKKLLIP